jgi:multiple sugar transport system ATP-binding protein
VVVHTAAGDVTVRTAPQVRVAPGERVGLHIQADHVNWFDPVSGQRMA